MARFSTSINNYWGKSTPESQNIVSVAGGSAGSRFITNASTDVLVSQANLVSFITSQGFTDVSKVTPDFKLVMTVQYEGGVIKTLPNTSTEEILSFGGASAINVYCTSPSSIDFEFLGKRSGETVLSRRRFTYNLNGLTSQALHTLSAIGTWLTSAGLTPEPGLASHTTAPTFATASIEQSAGATSANRVPTPPSLVVSVTWSYQGTTFVSVRYSNSTETISDLAAAGIHTGGEIRYTVEGQGEVTADVGNINDDGTNFVITIDAGSQIPPARRPSVGTVITVVS